MTRKICTWSESLTGENFKNWAGKASKLLGDIRDFEGLLMMDELWDALVQQEMITSQWKLMPPQDRQI